MTKPRSKATINATAAQTFVRNTGRIETLKGAIEKAQARGNTERVASLQSELDRRKADIDQYLADAKNS